MTDIYQYLSKGSHVFLQVVFLYRFFQQKPGHKSIMSQPQTTNGWPTTHRSVKLSRLRWPLFEPLPPDLSFFGWLWSSTPPQSVRDDHPHRFSPKKKATKNVRYDTWIPKMLGRLENEAPFLGIHSLNFGGVHSLNLPETNSSTPENWPDN